MKRYTLVSGLVLVFALLFLSGCGGGGERTFDTNYKIGYAVPFVVVDEQRSPSIFYEGRPFSLILALFNKAGYPLQNVRVTMGSYDQTMLSIDNPEHFFATVEARSAFTEDRGGRVDIPFSGTVSSLHGAEQRKETYRLYVSYDSSFEFAPTICINAARYDLFDAGCQMPTGAVSFAGQGAPVAITSMTEVVVGGESPELELRLKIADKGNGNARTIKLGRTRLGNTPLTCQFRDVLVNDDGSVSFKRDRREGEVLCTAPLVEAPSYQTTLFVEFWYSYEFSEARQITLRK
ncbi:hypothetical protein HY496_00670 [Candidatus Woesearchaeota archaeon]|nr:hypothetical protein [Candidatus Woesearchaeota archaeon]